jgi:ribonuclease T1
VGSISRKKSSDLGNKLVIACFFVFGIACTNIVQAKNEAPGHGLAVIARSELPPQGRDTYEKIQQGGPFAYDKDGVVFGNRERILPSHKRGYYREYTVKTPGSRDRGARRIVCGGKPTAPDDCYYTADHYSSFRKIAP